MSRLFFAVGLRSMIPLIPQTAEAKSEHQRSRRREEAEMIVRRRATPRADGGLHDIVSLVFRLRRKDWLSLRNRACV